MQINTAFVILLICFMLKTEAQDYNVGVWRSGTSGYYLWAGVDWDNFNAKWNELGPQNYRLVDIETYEVGGQRKFTGVWEYGTDGYYLWAGVDWTSLVAKWNELGPQGLRLIDIETYMDGSTRKYIGVWRSGTYGYYLYGGLDWNTFSTTWSNLGSQNFRLTDIETYMDGTTRKYIGIWEYGTDGYYLWAGANWADFSTLWGQLGPQGLRLIDVETYLDGNNNRVYIGVWRSGTDGYYLWAGVDWENFVSKWAENGVNNLRLIDYETYETNGCPSSCLNHALLPDNVTTPARESYNYGIKGGPIHCEVSPDSCTTPPAYVYYSWPNIQYGSEYYLRLSALNTNDQIFRLPFNDAASNMRKNGWLYSPGNWHHAIDYSRSDVASFQIVAAAPGKVIYIGWDNWSGNTVIISHDVGTTKDLYRTIYMHMRNGPNNDCGNAWTLTVPTLSGTDLTNFQNYLTNTGCSQNNLLRNPATAQWGTASQTISVTVGQTVSAGTVLGWAGSTGPGGCGCTSGGLGPNTHLHIFWAHRDTDGKWYFFDPYGVYATPDCYPSAVDGAVNTCSRYPVAWKNGKPGYL